MNAEELKNKLLTSDLEEFVDQVVLGRTTPHFSATELEFVREKLSSTFGAELEQEDFCVVGSAKLGYGLFEKRTKSGEILPAFRPFSVVSDIDIAITSSALFEIIWNELSGYSNAGVPFPWKSGKLGDYMICGWLRPDHFPKGARLRNCDDWNDVFRKMSRDVRIGRRTISGALYHSREHLRRYQIRGMERCRQTMENQR